MLETVRAPDAEAPGGKILVVDDESHVRDILCRWLADAGYECTQAADGQEAWNILRSREFSLVVSDILMPGMSGIELLTKIREERPKTAVLMVTAVDDRETATEALQLGAYGYVIKPFDEDEVVLNVANALERRRMVLASAAHEKHLEKTVREKTSEIRQSREEIALRLTAAQEYRHDETGAHVKRIGRYAEALARAMGRPEENAEVLRLAAPMHDVGKIGIPDAILMKPGALSPDEWEIMKTHTTIGYHILAGTEVPMLQLAAEIALAHHEKWDGSGYPHGLEKHGIPETARLVAVADVYDALVASRVYRPALPEEEALEIMANGRGQHFDPEVYDCFRRILPEIRRIRMNTRERPGDQCEMLTGVAGLVERAAV